MSTLKQATLNDRINGESVMAYAERLRKWANSEDEYLFLTPEAEHEQRTIIAAGLREAADALDEAAHKVFAATKTATDAAYARLYGR